MDPTCFTCQPNEPKMAHAYSHVAVSIGYFVLFILSLIQIKRLQKKISKVTYTNFAPCIILSVTILFKAILEAVLGDAYLNGQYLGVWKFVVLLLPGYLISTAYFMILFSWSFIFENFFGGKFFRITKVLIITLISLFLFFFVVIMLVLSKDIENKKMRYFESAVAMIRDFSITVMFLGLLIYLKINLEIKFRFMCNGSPHEVLFVLCSVVVIALIVRIAERIFFMWFVSSECSLNFYASWLLKELFGQFLPLMIILVSDFCTKYESSTDINHDPLILSR